MIAIHLSIGNNGQIMMDFELLFEGFSDISIVSFPQKDKMRKVCVVEVLLQT